MKIILILVLIFIHKSFASFSQDLVEAAHERLESNVKYDGSYFGLKYPNGDVPKNIGVCTDVIIRSYRKVGLDLQQLVHEDMKKSFSKYPSKRLWGLTKTDTNIDHRRVPNLQVFFKRHGESIPISSNKNDYKAGDIVTWILPKNLPHIGIVSDKKHWQSRNPMIIHNINSGPQIDDFLFSYKITGHYRYNPTK